MVPGMSRPRRSQPKASALARELKKAEKELSRAGEDEEGRGMPLPEFLEQVNQLAVQHLPEPEAPDSRVSRVFTSRSFRHYQTLGCIDPPERDGKQVLYGFRHLVQALLVRKLLGERLASERITDLVAGRSTAETMTMLLEGVEAVDGVGEREQDHGPDVVGLWKCVRVSPGVELHLSCDLPKPKPAAFRKLISDLEAALRRNL